MYRSSSIGVIGGWYNHSMVRRGWLLCLVTLAGCNPAFGIDPTTLAENVQALVFDNSASKIDLVDFPVLVTLDPTRVRYEDIGDPTTQLRFHDPDTSQDLAFEIERWAPGGQSLIWVKVPQIDAGSTTDRITMYTGVDAGGQEQPRDVWSAYAFVYHGTRSKLASTIGAFPGALTDGSTNTVSFADGLLAEAPVFTDDVESAIVFDNTGTLLTGWDRFSFELWLYPGYAPSVDLTGREPRYFTMGTAVHDGRVRPTDPGIDTLITPQIDISFEEKPTFLHPPIRREAWAYSVYTFDGQVLWVYRNGTAADYDSFVAPTRLVTDASGQLMIGGQPAMAGMIDEVRVTRSELPADWVLAQYRSMTGKFITFSEGG